jgi:hypothetical protein
LFIAQFFFLFFFLQSRNQSIQWARLIHPRCSCGNTACRLFAQLLACSSQSGLELASGSTGDLLFSHCNMAWRSFVQAGGSGCQSFASWWFFSATCGTSVSAKFLM